MINWKRIKIMRQLWANFISDDFSAEDEWETWRGVFDEKE
tara:strand:- start:6607 stop:6726 length:120 start_codon:yes stop_codon:yes gene_type:complete